MGNEQIKDLKEVLIVILTDADNHTLDLTELANRVQKDSRFRTTTHNEIVDAIKDLMKVGDTVKPSTELIRSDGEKTVINVRLDDAYVSPLAKNEHNEVTKLPTGKVLRPEDKNKNRNRNK